MRTLLHITALLGLALIARDAHAFSLEGTADIELSDTADSDPIATFVSLAGFERVVVAPGDWVLRAFAEFGPDDLVSGDDNLAGQIWFELPAPDTGSLDTMLDPHEAYARLTVWNASGAVIFEGDADTGWIDTDATWDSEEIHLVDIEFALSFSDQASDDVRTLRGVLFAGADAPAASPAGDRRVVRRVHHHGCAGGETVVVADPYYEDPYYYEDDAGCGGDDLDSAPYESDSSSGGCAGDDLDTGDTGGSSSNDETMSCAGDDSTTSDDDADDDSSSTDCEGDDLNAASLAPVPRPIAVRIARHIHIVLPVVFLLLMRRRERR